MVYRQPQYPQQFVGQQYPPSTNPSYPSDMNFQSGSYIQNHGGQPRVYGQKTGIGFMTGDGELTIPLNHLYDHLYNQSTLGAPPATLKEIIFLGPPSSPDWIQHFKGTEASLMTNALHILENVGSLQKITFSLDFTNFTEVLKRLARIDNMEEIVLTFPTVCSLEPYSISVILRTFVEGLKHFRQLKRLTIPMELLSSLLLSYLAPLPNFQALTIKHSSPFSCPSPFPPWSTYRDPTVCPGSIFLHYLQDYDRWRGCFQQLSYLDLGGPITPASYEMLSAWFPDTHICQHSG